MAICAVTIVDMKTTNPYEAAFHGDTSNSKPTQMSNHAKADSIRKQ